MRERRTAARWAPITLGIVVVLLASPRWQARAGQIVETESSAELEAPAGAMPSAEEPRIPVAPSLRASLVKAELQVSVPADGLRPSDGRSQAPQFQSDTTVRDKDGMVMVLVPSGTFAMGSTDGDAREAPVHEVTLDAFWLDQNEVTNAQYAAFVNAEGNQSEGGLGLPWLELYGGAGDRVPTRIHQSGELYSPESGYENHPVFGVRWYGARAYCAWVGGRLPTEAEWEYAAVGPQRSVYPWGSDPPREYANCEEGSCADGFVETAPVGSFPAGASWVGALDMAGNVSEWVSDFYSEDYYSVSPRDNPVGPTSGDYMALRGGDWSSGAFELRAAHRGAESRDGSLYPPGFRCAADAPGAHTPQPTDAVVQTGLAVQWVTRVSVSGTGAEADGRSQLPAISRDGRLIAFSSHAGNLVAGDTNGQEDVFVHDLRTRQTTRVSVSSDGLEADGSSWHAHISGDGRYVAFASEAPNLVPGDDNQARDIFVHDRQTGATERVSVSSSGEAGNAKSYAPFISADGRYVTFTSEASNLVPGDTNKWDYFTDGHCPDVFVHDRGTGVTERVSLDSEGNQIYGEAGYDSRPSISDNGRYVAYNQWDTDYRGVDLDRVRIRDREAGTTTIVPFADPFSWDSSISADGGRVAFLSGSPPVVYVADAETGEITRASVESGGVSGLAGYAYDARISADGSSVVFSLTGSRPEDEGIYLHNLSTLETVRVSSGAAWQPDVSAQGGHVVLATDESLAPDDTNGVTDIYVVGLVPGDPPPLSPVTATQEPQEATTPETVLTATPTRSQPTTAVATTPAPTATEPTEAEDADAPDDADTVPSQGRLLLRVALGLIGFGLLGGIVAVVALIRLRRRP